MAFRHTLTHFLQRPVHIFSIIIFYGIKLFYIPIDDFSDFHVGMHEIIFLSHHITSAPIIGNNMTL